MIESVEVCEWHDTFWRSRRLQVSPCPKVSTVDVYLHELTVADAFDDDLSHVYCTCGWIGPGFETDELAVREHNRLQGIETVAMSEWEQHPNAPLGEISDDDLPF